MNRQTSNFFLIVFVSILLTLSITIDAHIKKHVFINKHANKHANKHVFINKHANKHANKHVFINKHANKHVNKHANHVINQKTKCSTSTTTPPPVCSPTPVCCECRGSPGWNNIIYSVLPDQLVNITTSSTPRDCCNSCIADENCVSWYYNNQIMMCRHEVNTSTADACTVDKSIPSSFGDEGGVIRCNDDSSSTCN
ncbi:9726_t:CDS:1 [Scutellospora calospora]|uniref:9726_t:CDS:1 n=1 Tax=Scutellospora calospora TaxID=85575 RepID=A0ACA9MQU0_9GLOM|nr:9726_t:CDS:1 [Scutellospora calospora]